MNALLLVLQVPAVFHVNRRRTDMVKVKEVRAVLKKKEVSSLSWAASSKSVCRGIEISFLTGCNCVYCNLVRLKLPFFYEN